MLTTLFKIYLNVSYWRVDFTVTNQVGTGLASLILKTNKLPAHGNCSVSPTIGKSLFTFFNVRCWNWTDQDGQITKYEYMGIYDFDSNQYLSINILFIISV